MFKTLATRKSLTTRYIEAGSFNAYKMIVFSFEDYSKGSPRFFSFSKISLSPLDFLPSFFLSFLLSSFLFPSLFPFLLYIFNERREFPNLKVTSRYPGRRYLFNLRASTISAESKERPRALVFIAILFYLDLERFFYTLLFFLGTAKVYYPRSFPFVRSSSLPLPTISSPFENLFSFCNVSKLLR